MKTIRLEDDTARVVGPTTSSHERTLIEVTQTLASALDTDEVLRRLTQLALEALGAERCAILVCSPDEPAVLVPAAALSKNPDPDLRELFLRAHPLDIRTMSGMENVFERPAAMAIEDAQASRVIPREWKLLGSRSIAFSPLRVGSTSFGIIAIDYVSSIHRFSAAELSLLDGIACGAGLALRDAHLVHLLTRSADVQRRMLALTSALLSGGSLRQTLEHVIAGFHELLGVTHCAINRLLPGSRSFFTVANHGWDAPECERSFDEFPTDEVAYVEAEWRADPHKVIRIRDVQTFRAWSHLIPAGLGPVMLIPLTHGGNVRGFASIGRVGSADFDDEEVELALAFAHQATLAIREAEHRETLEGRAKAVVALRRLSGVTVGTTDLRGALSMLNKGVCRDLALECAGVTFSDRSLRLILNLADPSRAELATLRGWRRNGAGSIKASPSEPGVVLVPIKISGRIAGLLRLRGAIEGDPAAREFVQVLADGIGDVAYKAKLRRMAQDHAERLAVAEERERMARDLHDTIGQMLYGLSLRAQHCLALDLADPAARDEAKKRLAELNVLAAEGIRDVRSAVHALAFLHVKGDGLIRSLKALVREFERSTGIHTELRVTGSLRRRLSEETEGCLYRVAHEALVNVDRHSRATGVIAALEIADRHVTLSVRDDGVGLRNREAPDWRSAAHFGLRMMSRSVEALSGTFRAEPVAPRGLLIVARLPIGRVGRAEVS